MANALKTNYVLEDFNRSNNALGHQGALELAKALMTNDSVKTTMSWAIKALLNCQNADDK
jgi:hypothetical protein